MSKILLINGSPHARGCTATALGVVADMLEQNGIETETDEEGLQTMRVLGRDMAFLIRAIAREREAAGLPETEPQRIATNFIR